MSKKHKVGGQRDSTKPRGTDAQQPQGSNQASQGNDLQGEGNYDATRRYNAATERFVQSGKVEDAARAAAPTSAADAADMKDAERRGLARARDAKSTPDAILDTADSAELAIEKDGKAGNAKNREASRTSGR